MKLKLKPLLLLLMSLLALPPAALASPGTTALEDLNGKKTTLQTDKNKLLVVFWATWCPDCKEKLRTTLPELARRPDVSVLTINTDADAARVRAYVEREKVAVPVLRDPNKELRKELKVVAVPHWAVYLRRTAKNDWTLKDGGPAYDEARIQEALK